MIEERGTGGPNVDFATITPGSPYTQVDLNTTSVEGNLILDERHVNGDKCEWG